jgi:glycine/D-amino acid oxidase-like deaminating enzyme
MPLFSPYWLQRIPKKRRPDYPRLRGSLEVDVAIVGGGLTGCYAAYRFAAAGVTCALLDRGRIGEGGTAGGFGALLAEPEASFPAVASEYGLRAARQIWRIWRRSALDFAAALRRLGIRCGLAPLDQLEIALRTDQEKRLRTAFEARRAAGLEVAWLRPADVLRRAHVATRGAVRLTGGAALDPYAACVGLSRAAAKRGAAIFQDSPVSRIRPGSRRVEITTERGAVRARQVVVATGRPGRLFKPLERHFKATETYTVLTAPLPAEVRKEIGGTGPMLRGVDVPPHRLRWTDDDRLLFAGADQPQPPRVRDERILRQRTGQLMYELSLLYPPVSGVPADFGWAASLAATPDALPFVGPHRNYPRHVFALGSATATAGAAALAGPLLLRRYLEQSAKGDELFDFTRRFEP